MDLQLTNSNVVTVTAETGSLYSSVLLYFSRTVVETFTVEIPGSLSYYAASPRATTQCVAPRPSICLSCDYDLLE